MPISIHAFPHTQSRGPPVIWPLHITDLPTLWAFPNILEAMSRKYLFERRTWRTVWPPAALRPPSRKAFSEPQEGSAITVGHIHPPLSPVRRWGAWNLVCTRPVYLVKIDRLIRRVIQNVGYVTQPVNIICSSIIDYRQAISGPNLCVFRWLRFYFSWLFLIYLFLSLFLYLFK